MKTNLFDSESKTAQGAIRMRVCGWFLLLALIAVILFSGCRINTVESARRVARIKTWATKPIAEVKKVKRPGRVSVLGQLFRDAPAPSDRTLQLLRRYNLDKRYKDDPQFVVRWLQDICRNSPNMEEVHALAEIALIQGDWMVRIGRKEQAASLYAVAMVQAHQFLFDADLNIQRNAYDPQFRSICDIYNGSLTGMLRLMCNDEPIHNGYAHTCGEGDSALEVTVQMEGRWSDHEFEAIEIAGDYEMGGIKNLYHTYGLGVPLIAVHGSHDHASISEDYYPPKLTLPMTAFCEVYDPPSDSSGERQGPRRAAIKLYDPLETTFVRIGGRSVPLESDITTPLAYHLDDPLLSSGILETATMLNAQLAEEVFGLFMLEPYDPGKIPVVMVHGLWSSPVTWLEMFNDLRSNRELTKNYQFWFYSYPTGQPFWISARQMRDDLAALRQDLDPAGDSKTLGQMVLVGHSMGGLISRLQTIDSEDEFWSIISNSPPETWDGDPENLKVLRDTFVFEASPHVKRVVTIASPHEGSKMANKLTQWASQKIFTLPDTMTTDFRELAKENEDHLTDPELLTVTTSIDSLSPESPFFQVMNQASTAPDVRYHNIVGNVAHSSWLGKGSARGDGVVSLDSARALEVESEIEVPAQHQQVHRHPRAILEVRRILLSHLANLGRVDNPRVPVIPTGYEEEIQESGQD